MPPCPEKWWGYSPTSPTVCAAPVQTPGDCRNPCQVINDASSPASSPGPPRFTQHKASRWAMTLMRATSMLLAIHPWLINNYKVKTSDIYNCTWQCKLSWTNRHSIPCQIAIATWRNARTRKVLPDSRQANFQSVCLEPVTSLWMHHTILHEGGGGWQLPKKSVRDFEILRFIRRDFGISMKIWRFQMGFRDFYEDLKISVRISGFLWRFLSVQV